MVEITDPKILEYQEKIKEYCSYLPARLEDSIRELLLIQIENCYYMGYRDGINYVVNDRNKKILDISDDLPST